jgi:hypothetical protein
MGITRLTIISAWLGGVLFLIFRLSGDHSDERLADLAMAAVVARQGEVLVKDELNIAWQNVAKRRYLYEFDLVSTGPDGWVKLVFKNKQEMLIGPNSQVRLKKQAVFTDKYEISLRRGQIKFGLKARSPRNRTQNRVDAAASAQGSVKVRTGNYSVEVGGGQGTASIKKVDYDGPAEFSADAGSVVTVKNEIEGETSSLKSQPKQALRLSAKPSPYSVAVEPETTPQAKPAALVEPSPKTATQPFPPALATKLRKWNVLPADGQLWVIPDSLPHDKWRVPLGGLPSPEDASISEAEMMVRVKRSPADKHGTLIKRVNLKTDRSFQLSWSELGRLKLHDDVGPKVVLRLEAILKFKRPGSEVLTLNRQSKLWVIQPLKGGAARIGLDWGPDRKMNQGKFALPNSKPSEVIILNDPTYFHDLAEKIAGSTRLSYQPFQTLSGSRTYLVRDHRIIGSLEKKGNDLSFDEILSTFDASLAFQGPASAFLGGSEVLDQKGGLGKLEGLYFVHRGLVLPIDQGLIRTHRSAKKFLARFDPDFMSQPVEIIAVSRR